MQHIFLYLVLTAKELQLQRSCLIQAFFKCNQCASVIVSVNDAKALGKQHKAASKTHFF